jgi:Tol biopolymer transport system component
VLLWLAVGFGVFLLTLVVVAAVIIHRLNTPQTVPASWHPPTALPRSTGVPIPPGNLVFDSNRTGNYEIWTMMSTGGDAHQLTADRAYDSWWPRLSPDRRTILFYRTPKGVHDRNYSLTSLWAMAADGTREVELRPAGLGGWVLQGHAEWSPDGTQLVMFGGSRFSPQIWVTDDLGRRPRAVTNRGGSNVDPSWSPNGRTIAFVGCPGSFCLPSDHEIYTIAVTGGQATRITYDTLEDNDPYFSRDGRQLAWLTKTSGGIFSLGTWNIRRQAVIKKDGRVEAAPRTHPVSVVPGNDAINSKPSWSLDDTTIYFHRAGGGIAGGFQIFAINVNGTDLRQITIGTGGSNEYPGT